MLTVTAENLGQDFGERRVLADISLTIAPGDRLLVRGPNGSGKSTLLRILAGLLEPTRGSLTWTGDGAEVTEADRRCRVGYLAPDLVLYEHLTVRENLEFFARVRGLPRGSAVTEAIRGAGLAGREDDPVGTLSTGLRQRAKLAFATQAAPDLLLLDEPSSNLDVPGRDLVASVVAETAKHGAVVIATNDPGEFSLGNQELVLAG